MFRTKGDKIYIFFVDQTLIQLNHYFEAVRFDWSFISNGLMFHWITSLAKSFIFMIVIILGWLMRENLNAKWKIDMTYEY